jgi:hypothetical protein
VCIEIPEHRSFESLSDAIRAIEATGSHHLHLFYAPVGEVKGLTPGQAFLKPNLKFGLKVDGIR